MKIAYICADLGVPVFGSKGCSVHVQEVVRAMLAAGAQVDLYAVRLGGAGDQRLRLVRTINLCLDRHDGPAEREQAAIAINDQLPSLLVTNGPYDLVYERYSLWSSAAMCWANKAGVPSVLEVNAPLIEEQKQYRGLINQAEAESSRQKVFDAADTIVSVSDPVAEYVEHFGVERSRIVTSPNGIDPERFPQDQPPATPGEPGVFTVGFVGTLKPWHGVSILIDAFALLRAKHANVRLLIVGDGPERDRIASQLSDLELNDAAELTGSVGADEIPGLIASMDVGVAPYPPGEHYFSPMKVMEYMAAGIPVVASRIGQLTSVIDKSTGMLCAAGDFEALADALIRLYADRSLCTSMGQSGRSYVLQNHTWQAYVQRIMACAHADPICVEPVGAGGS